MWAASWSRRSRGPSPSRCCSRPSRNTSDHPPVNARDPRHASLRGVDSGDVVPEEIDIVTGEPAPRWVAPLAAFGRDDVASAGGKAANLGELVRAGLPVPPGFVVTTTAYREFVAGHGLTESIVELSREVDDPEAAVTAAELISDLFRHGNLDPALREAVIGAYDELGRPP